MTGVNIERLVELDKAAIDEAANAFHQMQPPRPNRWAHRTLGVVLAGGRSRRMMEEDKALIEISGQTMLDRVVTRLGAQVSGLVINSNGSASRFKANLPVVADITDDFAGPLAGILATMRWAERHAPHAFWLVSAAVDTPFFPHDLVDRMVMAMGGPEPAVVLAQSGEQVHPTFGLWPIALADDLEAFLMRGDRKVLLWAEQHLCSRAIFTGPTIDGIEIDPFFNVNCPDDIDVAEAIADGLSDMRKKENKNKDEEVGQGEDAK